MNVDLARTQGGGVGREQARLAGRVPRPPELLKHELEVSGQHCEVNS